MGIPKLNDRVVCITDDPILGAVISSYFSNLGEYFVVFPIHSMKTPPTGITGRISLEYVTIHTQNRIIQLKPDRIIMAGLNGFQRSNFKLPSRLITVIDSLDDVVEKMQSIQDAPTEVLACSPNELSRGLFIAKNMKCRLAIEQDAVLPDYQVGDREAVIVIEKGEDLSAICTANLAHACNADLKFVDPLKSTRAYDKKMDIEKAGNGYDGYFLDDQIVFIRERISGIDFSLYQWATFLTSGIPYSLVLNNVLPTCLLNRSSAASTIFDTLFKEQFSDYFYSAVLFSVPIDEDGIERDDMEDEAPVVGSLLDQYQYLVVFLANKLATKRNFSNFVGHFPYDALHIGSHGGRSEGMFHRSMLTDKNGQSHTFDYYEVVDFEQMNEIGPDGHPMIAAVSMFVPVTFDGYAWGSEELANNRSKEDTKVVEDLILEMYTPGHLPDISVPTNIQIPHSRIIKCIDNVHQGQFHYVADQTAPFIFNNSCSSWFDMGTSFINVGARAYIGTLWNIGTDTAKQSAECFYEYALKGEKDLMTACHLMNNNIQNPKYKNIYVYWGLPWTYIKAPSIPRPLAIYGIIVRMKKAVARLQEKNADPDYDGEMKKRNSNIISFFQDKIETLPSMYWRSFKAKKRRLL